MSDEITRKLFAAAHDAAAEMRHRANQLRCEADALDRESARLTEKVVAYRDMVYPPATAPKAPATPAPTL
jgi:hypothetical protein